MNESSVSLSDRLLSAYLRFCMRCVRRHVLAGHAYWPAWQSHRELSVFLRKQEQVCRQHRMSPHRKQSDRMRVAFVIPWFGKDVSGGAEAETYGLIQACMQHAPELEIEVLTSTLPEFAQDWNRPAHPEGLRMEEGIGVRRFHPRVCDREFFHCINGTYLMPGGTDELWVDQHTYRSPLPPVLESYAIQSMIHLPGLISYMESSWDDYDGFVMIPYMFSSSVMGCAVAGRKGVVIPCLHKERYAHMRVYAEAFARVGTVLCHVRSEASLFERLYPRAPQPILLGEQVDTTVAPGNAERFRSKYGVEGPFLLYAGRQVSGKNVPLLIEYFRALRQQHPVGANLQLVLIGKGDLDYSQEPGVRCLGFVPPQDKIDAFRAATALAMLSVNESFSIVLMESWLQETPVVVSSECDVTRDHVEDSNGGVAVADSESFADVVLRWLESPEQASEQGRKGRAYVLANYTAERIANRFRDALFNTIPIAE